MGTYARRNVVLVHGGFVDGSGWQGVYDSLSRDGFRASIVQNPTLSLQGDAEATRQIIDAQDGPVVLVGHSLRRRGHNRGRDPPERGGPVCIFGT